MKVSLSYCVVEIEKDAQRPCQHRTKNQATTEHCRTEHCRNIAGGLTSVAHKPSIVIEQATSSYSFRSSELSQPI